MRSGNGLQFAHLSLLLLLIIIVIISIFLGNQLCKPSSMNPIQVHIPKRTSIFHSFHIFYALVFAQSTPIEKLYRKFSLLWSMTVLGFNSLNSPTIHWTSSTSILTTMVWNWTIPPKTYYFKSLVTNGNRHEAFGKWLKHECFIKWINPWVNFLLSGVMKRLGLTGWNR